MFNEFNNPESKDYDITSSFEEENYTDNNDNELAYELANLIGILEDGEQPPYGLTYEEYLHPTKETIKKVKETMQQEEQVHYHK